MLIRPPKSRFSTRSKFSSSIARTREKYYALFSILVVKIALFASLWVLFGTSLRAFRGRAKSMGQFWSTVFLAFIAIIAIFLGYHIFKNIKDIKDLDRELKNRQ